MLTHTVVELKRIAWGLFAHLAKIMEWIYCAKNNENLILYLNMQGSYSFHGDVFQAFFHSFDDPVVKIGSAPGGAIVTDSFPSLIEQPLNLKRYAADDLKMRFDPGHYKYVYLANRFYKDPDDFNFFCDRLHPIVNQYIRPREFIQQRIDQMMDRMNSCYKIGIHIRSLIHYKGCNQSTERFLDDLERDIDRIMESKDPAKTKIYVATLCDPVVTRLSRKYGGNLVVPNIRRTVEMVKTDWDHMAPTIHDIVDAVVDTWCLANCDELWGGASNVTIFARCINRNLKVNLLNCLKDYDVL